MTLFPDDLISTREAADLLDLGRTKFPARNCWRYLMKYDVPVYRRGGRILVSRTSLLNELREAADEHAKARQQRGGAR
ncbi:MAG TPA: hypothetical protein VG871_11270 [Vicinamibacterales bacterium]|jgi:hypothetical protein|nr:hypothetical protein [Vicinamibacterales bacterium]HWB17018.1 hypothetical protein [Vicinamibacterales bacterium]